MANMSYKSLRIVFLLGQEIFRFVDEIYRYDILYLILQKYITNFSCRSDHHRDMKHLSHAKPLISHRNVQ